MKMKKSNGILLALAIAATCGYAATHIATVAQADTSSTLLGVDADNNGIRDDIDAYIASSIPPALQTHVGHIARAFSNFLVIDPGDRQAVRDSSNSLFSEMRCAREEAERLEGRGIDIDVSEISLELEKRTFNTKARHNQYLRANQQASGMVFGTNHCKDAPSQKLASQR
jgi:hypothetical protein